MLSKTVHYCKATPINHERFIPAIGSQCRAPPSVVATLRQPILAGRYQPGTRLAEIPVAAELGVSRTPVRLAFRTLAQEGLLQRVGKRGLDVRAFTEADVLCAVEVRGVLEGLAARRLSEAGVPAPLMAQLHNA